jgi:hypothetical protein
MSRHASPALYQSAHHHYLASGSSQGYGITPAEEQRSRQHHHHHYAHAPRHGQSPTPHPPPRQVPQTQYASAAGPPTNLNRTGSSSDSIQQLPRREGRTIQTASMDAADARVAQKPKGVNDGSVSSHWIKSEHRPPLGPAGSMEAKLANGNGVAHDPPSSSPGGPSRDRSVLERKDREREREGTFGSSALGLHTHAADSLTPAQTQAQAQAQADRNRFPNLAEYLGGTSHNSVFGGGLMKNGAATKVNGAGGGASVGLSDSGAFSNLDSIFNRAVSTAQPYPTDQASRRH